MEARALFVICLSAFFFLGVHSATFTVKNNCPYTIYPGIATGSSSASTSPSTGFELASQASNDVTIPSPWTGRFWARFVCSNSGGKLTCLSGDCGTGQIACNNQTGTTPATLLEFTLGGSGGLDFYDVSLVDGFNLPAKIEPSAGCRAPACPVDVNAKCPAELQVKNPSDQGVIGCKSACVAFNTPEACCQGQYGSPTTCPTSPLTQFFKGLCPDAYSYAYDDKSATCTCPTGTNYVLTFCP